MNHIEEYTQLIVIELLQYGEYRSHDIVVNVKKEIKVEDIHEFIKSIGCDNFTEFYSKYQCIHNEPEDVKSNLEYLLSELSNDSTRDVVEAIQDDCEKFVEFKKFIREKYRQEVIRIFLGNFKYVEVKL